MKHNLWTSYNSRFLVIEAHFAEGRVGKGVHSLLTWSSGDSLWRLSFSPWFDLFSMGFKYYHNKRNIQIGCLVPHSWWPPPETQTFEVWLENQSEVMFQSWDPSVLSRTSVLGAPPLVLSTYLLPAPAWSPQQCGQWAHTRTRSHRWWQWHGTSLSTWSSSARWLSSATSPTEKTNAEHEATVGVRVLYMGKIGFLPPTSFSY